MKHTEASIFSLIRDYYVTDRRRGSDGAYVVLSGVRNTTGFASSRIRMADAIVMSLWPSRGLTLSGFEIKVTRQDWKRELDEPAKAEEISRFCDNWYIAAPVGVVDHDRLPPTWGLFEAGEKKLSLVRHAQLQKDVQPITRGFLGALLRAATKDMVPMSKVESMVSDQIEARVEAVLELRVGDAVPKLRELEQKIRMLENDLKRERSRVEMFESKSGIRVDEYNGGPIGKAVDAIRWQTHDRMAKSLEDQAVSLRRAAERADEAAQELRSAGTIGEEESAS